MKKIIRLLPVLILLIIISCDNKKQKEQPLQNDNKEIILYCNGCEEDTEIISDLENLKYSLDSFIIYSGLYSEAIYEIYPSNHDIHTGVANYYNSLLNIYNNVMGIIA